MARVLLVDDDEASILELGNLLRADGHVVHAAHDAVGALSAFGAHHPEIVLVNLTLAGTPSHKLAEKFRMLDPRLPLIIITGSRDVDTVRPAVRLAAFDLLFKPISHAELSHAVTEALLHRNVTARQHRREPNDASYEKQLESLADERAHALHQSNAQLVGTVEGVARALATLVEEREESPKGSHQERVATLARALAKEVRIPIENIMGVYLAAMMHDIGILRIPLDVLHKSAPLDAAELAMLQLHPQSAHDLLKPIPFAWPVAEIVLQHHERYDGSGYPQGLRGQEILVEAAIVGLADEVDAMLSPRPYRACLSTKDILAEMPQYRNRLFSSALVDAFTGLVSSGRYILDE